MSDTRSALLKIDETEKKVREASLDSIESEIDIKLATLQPSGKKRGEGKIDVLTDNDIGKYLKNIQRTIY